MQVGRELNVVEACAGLRRSVDCGLLAVTDFECDKTPGNKSGEGLRDETTIDAEPVVGEEGECGLVIANFDGEGIAVSGQDVGGLETMISKRSSATGAEEIALQKADAGRRHDCIRHFARAIAEYGARRYRWQ